MSRSRSVLALAAWMAVCLAAGAVGSVFTVASATTWYVTLVKPPLNPPAWVFAPVWTTLYLIMGVAAWLVWRRRAAEGSAQVAIAAFVVQLVLNALWSPIFFGLHATGPAFAELVILWLAIAVTTMLFARVRQVAAWLMAPYLAWVSFAGYLNFMVWRLNA